MLFDEIEWICDSMLQQYGMTPLMLLLWIGPLSLQVKISNLLVMVTLTCSQMSLWIECGSLSVLRFLFQKEDPQVLKYAVLTLSVCLRRWPKQEWLIREVLQNTMIRKVCDCIHYCDPLVQ